MKSKLILGTAILGYAVTVAIASSSPSVKTANLTVPANFQITQDIQVLENSQYTAYFNKSMRSAIATFEVLSPEDFTNPYVRDAKFVKDPRVLNSPRPEEYTNTGFDRGHLSAASNTTNPKFIKETFLMSNIVPQAKSLNRGLWKTLETFAKFKALRSNVKVTNGVVYKNCEQPSKIGNLPVPDYMFKIIQIEGNLPQAWLFPNNDKLSAHLEDYQIDPAKLPALCGVRIPSEY